MSRAGQRPDLDGVAVSFDFDGVLARSPFGHGVLFPVLREMALAASARTGIPSEQEERRARELARAEFRARTARGEYVQAYNWQATVELVARALGGRFDGSLAALTLEYAAKLESSGDLSPAYPYARELLRDLKGRGACLLLLTNGFREYQLPVTRALGLERYLDAIYAADDCGSVKPFAEAFDKAFSACPRAGRSCRYHVGDTLTHDVLGARLAGVFSIWIDWELPEGLTRLEPLERSRSPALEGVLRAKLDREETLHGLAGFESPTADAVRPDAVVASLREVEGVIDQARASTGPSAVP